LFRLSGCVTRVAGHMIVCHLQLERVISVVFSSEDKAIIPDIWLFFDNRQSLAPQCVNPRLSLYALPKAWLTKPDVFYSEPYTLRPYSER
jgi:hypothetical protein